MSLISDTGAAAFRRAAADSTHAARAAGEEEHQGREEDHRRLISQRRRREKHHSRHAHLMLPPHVSQAHDAAVNLALSLARSGLRAGILDTDIFGPSIPTLMNLSGEPRLSASQSVH